MAGSGLINGKFSIIEKEWLTPHCFRVRIEAPDIPNITKPGQFYQIKVSQGYDPLLPRPFSVHKIHPDGVSFLIEVVGRGTGMLAQKRVGDSLHVIGPYGNGFYTDFKHLKVALLGGGMGIAPLVGLLPKLCEHEVFVFIGARCEDELLCIEEFREADAEVFIATDDGSRGYKGFVSELFEEELDNLGDVEVVACGPEDMMKRVAEIALARGLPCQLSLTAYMACGFGGCFGCVVPGKEGFVRVCKEGPVFRAEEIRWEEF